MTNTKCDQNNFPGTFSQFGGAGSCCVIFLSPPSHCAGKCPLCAPCHDQKSWFSKTFCRYETSNSPSKLVSDLLTEKTKENISPVGLHDTDLNNIFNIFNFNFFDLWACDAQSFSLALCSGITLNNTLGTDHIGSWR